MDASANPLNWRPSQLTESFADTKNVEKEKQGTTNYLPFMLWSNKS
jgi:hypothetical protein